MLRSYGFDYCVNLTSARGITNDEVALLSGAQEVFCLNNNWKYLTKLFGQIMDHRYDKILDFHTISEPVRNVNILEYIVGAKVSNATSVFINAETEARADRVLDTFLQRKQGEKIIAISPLSDEQLKNWPISHYEELCRQIVQHYDVKILLLGTPQQKASFDHIALVDREKIINLAGKLSIVESAAIVKHSVLFIGNDSGFTHIAKALRKKLIGIIGGGGNGLFFPYSVTDHESYLFHQLDCFGCEWKCYRDKPYCMHNVTVEQVLAKVDLSLNNGQL